MPRYCFQLQVEQDRMAEYVGRHQAVWPEMQDALRATGWRNYSLFLRDDGLLIGYVEEDDLAASRAAMEALDVNTRWQTDMAAFFSGTTPSDGFPQLREVFHLESS